VAYVLPDLGRPGQRRRLEIDLQTDFRGGLNLRKDAWNLDHNESPDLMNVDVGERGGFRLRNGMKPYVETAVSRDVDSLIAFYKSDGTRQLIAAGNGGTWWLNGVTWDPINTVVNDVGPTVGATMKDRIYLTHPGFTAGTVRWDGSTAVVLSDAASAYNNDLQSPTGHGSNGRHPIGNHKAVHHEVMWADQRVGVPTGVPPGARLRWSHPGFPEDWRANDYIDIDLSQGPITALVPFADRLLVFFERAIYAVHGYPPNSFSVNNITKQVGTSHPYGVCASETAVYFWDSHLGACRYDGRGVEYLFEPLQIVFNDGTLDDHRSSETRVEAHNRRVYFTLAQNEVLTGHDKLLYVYDIDLQAWVRHDNPPDAMLAHFHPIGGDHIHILGAYGSHVYRVDEPGLKHDEIWVPELPDFLKFKIDAYYVTRWFDARNFVERKRWKRPEIALLSGATAQYRIGVLKDYNPRQLVREFRVTTEASQIDVNGLQEGVWDTSNWDEALWGGGEIVPTPEGAEVLRGSPLGNARAVALKFFGPEMVVVEE
jgi:hypothetical protein